MAPPVHPVTAQWNGPYGDTTSIVHGLEHHMLNLDGNFSCGACQAACAARFPDCTAWTYQPTGIPCKGGAPVPSEARVCYGVVPAGSGDPLHPCLAHVSGFWGSPPPPPTPPPLPIPTPRQLEWMAGRDPIVGGLSQFMHFSLPTFWIEGDIFDPKGTYHNCMTNAPYCSQGNSCDGGYAPCLRPDLFNPTDLDAEQWVLAAKELGAQEICLTAQHEGGFTLWPSNYTNYSVAAATVWRGGKGDVLREFAAACNKHQVGICYYLHPSCDHYSSMVANVSAAEFSARQKGKIEEVLREYGPVNRLWFDGKGKQSDGTRYPLGLNLTAHFQGVLEIVRSVSPSTLVTGYREWGGDIGDDYHSLYTFDSTLVPNTTSMATVGKPLEGGAAFFPLEQVGICMQEGPDGNTNASPTYWFEHPLVGHANASRIFDSWLNLVGHGENAMVNIAPGRSGQLDAAYVAVMTDVGKAIRNTFTTPIAALPAGGASANCSEPTVLHLPDGKPFDYVETREDLTRAQRIMNYSIEYTSDGVSWHTLVPAINRSSAGGGAGGGLMDRPAGADKRDQHVGFRRIDVPIIARNVTAAARAIRFRCLRALTPEYHLASLAVFKRSVPWEEEEEDSQFS